MKGLRGCVGGRWVAFGLALLMIIGAALRLAPIGANRFHQDEALYSFWALQITTGRDPILSHFRVDKPPLFIYTLALCFKLFGPSEVAARLPSELASVASIALLYYLAWRLYGRAVAMVAAILMALSPFNILFAPTVFTDPLMVAWVLAALCLAAKGPALMVRQAHHDGLSKGSLGWCGLMLGLAVATKQQGLLFVPLAVVIAARRFTPPPPAPPPTLGEGSPFPPSPRVGRGGLGGRGLHQSSAPAPPPTLREVFFLALGFLAIMAPVVWWDSLRWRLQPNYFEQSLISYGGLALVDLAQLVERLGDWAEILCYITASPFLNILLLGGLPCLILYDLVRRRREPATFFDVVLSAFAILFLLGHWLLSFNVWDRYLLGLVPLLLILLARILWLVSEALASIHPSLPGRGRGRVGSHKWTRFPVKLAHFDLRTPTPTPTLPLAGGGGGQSLVSRRPIRLAYYPSERWLLQVFLVVVFLTATLAGPALRAARSGYPIGGDHGAYDGIEAVAGYFRDSVPAGSILYHHWLGWHYSFYMFDFPLVFRWYPSPEELAEDASQVDDAQRYIVFPSGKLTAGVRDALAEVGLMLRRVYWTYRRDGSASFTVYWIEDQK